jgi:hypothetical protein
MNDKHCSEYDELKEGFLASLENIGDLHNKLVRLCDAIPVRGPNATRDNLKNALRLYYTLFVVHESIEGMYEKLSALKGMMSNDTLPECFKACGRKREAIGQVNFDLVKARGEKPRVKVSYQYAQSKEDRARARIVREMAKHYEKAA